MKFKDIKIDECYVYSNYTARSARLEGDRIYPLATECYLRTGGGTYRSAPNYRPFKRGEYKPYDGTTGLVAITVGSYVEVPDEVDQALRELTIEQIIANGGRVPEDVIDLLVSHRINFLVQMVQIQWVNQTWAEAQEAKVANEARWAKEREEKATRDDAQFSVMNTAADVLARLLGTRPTVTRASHYDPYHMKLNEEQAVALGDLAKVILPGGAKN